MCCDFYSNCDIIDSDSCQNIDDGCANRLVRRFEGISIIYALNKKKKEKKKHSLYPFKLQFNYIKVEFEGILDDISVLTVKQTQRSS